MTPRTRRRFAVVGNPVAHSLSPRIHALFGEAAGIELDYERLRAPLDDFAGTVEHFLRAGGAGFNVTLPFKEQAYAWADETDRDATRARAVNTVVATDRRRGYNTDGPGLLRDLDVHGVAVAARRILVVGAGGAVRGVLGPLLDAAPDEIVIANRTPERALRLAGELSDARICAVPFDALSSPFDLVVNGTSASLLDDVPPLPERAVRDAFCYDMAYGHAPTPFSRWAMHHGAVQAVDGLGMLIEQAALAFELWHGVLPSTAGVRSIVRRELASR